MVHKNLWLSQAENEQIVSAIKLAETTTSGEIRVFIEAHCKFVDARNRAALIFEKLAMHHTDLRNGVLIYIAFSDKQFAIVGDEGIHQKILKHNASFWKEESAQLKSAFKNEDFTKGICTLIVDLGKKLSEYFPYQEGMDKNELPDEIVFG